MYNILYSTLIFSSYKGYLYLKRKDMQCPIMVAKKVTRYSNFNDASNACNENSNCFAIYDVKCRGTEYYECENEKKWNNLTSFAKESDYSCLHFKHNVGNLGNFILTIFNILTKIFNFVLYS